MFVLRPVSSNKTSNYLNPFQELDELERRFFSDPFHEFVGRGDLAEFKTDIQDKDDHFLMEMDMPGFAKEDIHLDLNGDTLTVSAERHSEHEDSDKKKNYVHVERSYGSYSRSFDISGVAADQIKAKYEDGVLKLTLPKKQPELPQSRKLEIE